MDVVFLIDLGVQSGPHSVQFFTEYIMSVLRLFDIEDRNTRVALVTYGSNSLDGLVILGLREGNNHRAIQLKLQELIKGFYTFSLSRALRKAGSIFATSPRAAQKLVFVITFTPMVGSAELAEILAAGRALGSGVSIYLVAIDGASSDHLLAQLMLNRNMFRGSYKITQDYDILDIVERTQDALKQQYRCDECTTNQCPRYQSCTSVGGQTVCVCNLGYVDGYCSDTDPCRASPCPPGQICRRNGFSHTCQPDDADTCLGTVCLNQAQCFIEQGMPKCQCTPGYVGDSCQARCPRCSAKHFCLFENQRAVCKCRSRTSPKK
uniref:Fibropellin-1-like n=1 Tax=Phallusia mammillata TaxID=59560 RepID=A0A6F9D963_9ASCI|nr:fibropellin-1-like [Phallusia mammillata]